MANPLATLTRKPSDRKGRRVQTSIDTDAEAVVTLHVLGEVDTQVKANLIQAIVDVLETGPRQLVIDLAEVTFLDSSGLGALIEGYRRATAENVGYSVRGARDNVQRVLDVSGVGDLF